MALISCPECKREVSDRAESCPHCGCPLAAAPDVVGGRQVRTVEKTAKRFKGQIALSTLLLLIGVFWTCGSCVASRTTGEVEGLSPWGMLLTAFGGIWLLAAKTNAWWHHG